jgi:hypothetical protein
MTKLSRSEIQKRWYEKLKADPVRYAAFQAKYNAAVNRRYHDNKQDPAYIERRRELGRKTFRKRYPKLRRDKAYLAKKREADMKPCRELSDKYVRRTIAMTTGIPKNEIPDTLVFAKKQWMHLCRKLGTKLKTV